MTEREREFHRRVIELSQGYKGIAYVFVSEDVAADGEPSATTNWKTKEMAISTLATAIAGMANPGVVGNEVTAEERQARVLSLVPKGLDA